MIFVRRPPLAPAAFFSRRDGLDMQGSTRQNQGATHREGRRAIGDNSALSAPQPPTPLPTRPNPQSPTPINSQPAKAPAATPSAEFDFVAAAVPRAPRGTQRAPLRNPAFDQLAAMPAGSHERPTATVPRKGAALAPESMPLHPAISAPPPLAPHITLSRTGPAPCMFFLDKRPSWEQISPQEIGPQRIVLNKVSGSSN